MLVPVTRSPPSDTPSDDLDSTGSSPSKTRRKHAMHALQDLGERLVALSPENLKLLDLPERLADAIGLARGIRAHEGRRRQMQYIGKLMRTVDAEPIEVALAQILGGLPDDREAFAAVEQWRERLLGEPGAELEYVQAHPHVDRARLSTLIRDARGERGTHRPPHRYRELFRYLRAVAADISAADTTAAADAATSATAASGTATPKTTTSATGSPGDATPRTATPE